MIFNQIPPPQGWRFRVREIMKTKGSLKEWKELLTKARPNLPRSTKEQAYAQMEASLAGKTLPSKKNERKSTMLINLSNHPSTKWSEAQLSTAAQYGAIIDMAFPNIDPLLDTEEVRDLAKHYFTKIEDIRQAHRADVPVHLMGESTFVYCLVDLLKMHGYAVFASTTERVVVESIEPDGSTKKEVLFRFVRFRYY